MPWGTDRSVEDSFSIPSEKLRWLTRNKSGLFLTVEARECKRSAAKDQLRKVNQVTRLKLYCISWMESR